MIDFFRYFSKFSLNQVLRSLTQFLIIALSYHFFEYSNFSLITFNYFLYGLSVSFLNFGTENYFLKESRKKNSTFALSEILNFKIVNSILIFFLYLIYIIINEKFEFNYALIFFLSLIIFNITEPFLLNFKIKNNFYLEFLFTLLPLLLLTTIFLFEISFNFFCVYILIIRLCILFSVVRIEKVSIAVLKLVIFVKKTFIRKLIKFKIFFTDNLLSSISLNSDLIIFYYFFSTEIFNIYLVYSRVFFLTISFANIVATYILYKELKFEAFYKTSFYYYIAFIFSFLYFLFSLLIPYLMDKEFIISGTIIFLFSFLIFVRVICFSYSVFFTIHGYQKDRIFAYMSQLTLYLLLFMLTYFFYQVDIISIILINIISMFCFLFYLVICSKYRFTYEKEN